MVPAYGMVFLPRILVTLITCGIRYVFVSATGWLEMGEVEVTGKPIYLLANTQKPGTCNVSACNATQRACLIPCTPHSGHHIAVLSTTRP